MALTRDEVLAAIAQRRAEHKTVQVPEWGGDILVRRLTPEDVERTGLADGKRDAQMFARVIAASCVNDDGTPSFTDADVTALADADMGTVSRVFAEIVRLNGLGDKDLEEAVQAFEKAQRDGSSTS